MCIDVCVCSVCIIVTSWFSTFYSMCGSPSWVSYFVAYFDSITTFKALDHGTYIGQVSYTLHTCKCMNVRYICEVHTYLMFMKASDIALQTQ